MIGLVLCPATQPRGFSIATLTKVRLRFVDLSTSEWTNKAQEREYPRSDIFKLPFVVECQCDITTLAVLYRFLIFLEPFEVLSLITSIPMSANLR